MIPDFQTLMLPFLELLKDGKEHDLQEIIEALSLQFKLTNEERAARLPSGNQVIITNRVSWVKSHLKIAQLIESPRRGASKITSQGLDVLNKNLKKIDLKFLKTLPAYTEWRKDWNSLQKKDEKDIEIKTSLSEDVDNAQTPEELLELSFAILKKELASELIEKIKGSSPYFFESLVVDLLIKMGYGGSRKEAGQVIGKSGDGGIDGIIKEDKLGLDAIYIQAKRWEATVPVGQVRDFAGSLLSKKAKKGIFITTSNYPKAAYEFVASIEPRIILIDGKELADLLIEYNVGISTKTNYEVKRIDLDYFEEN